MCGKGELCTMKSERTTTPLTDMGLKADDILPITPEISFILNFLICLATLLLSFLSVILYLRP